MSPLGCAVLHSHHLMCFDGLPPLQEDGGSRAPPLRLLSEREAVGFLWSDDDSLARRWGDYGVIGWRQATVATRPTCCSDFLLPAKAVGHLPRHQLSCPSHSRSPTPTPCRAVASLATFTERQVADSLVQGRKPRNAGGSRAGSASAGATLFCCAPSGATRPSVHRSRWPPPTPPHLPPHAQRRPPGWREQ